MFLSMSPSVIAKGRKTSLRNPAATDFAVLSGLRNDPAIQRQLMIAPVRYSPAKVRAWLKRRTEDPNGVFFVVDADGPNGFAQLTRIDRQTRTADLGICLSASARGAGVATEAMALLEEYARRKLDCKIMTLRVLRINHRAIGFYRKVGYQDVAIERRSHNDDGRMRDVLFMRKELK